MNEFALKAEYKAGMEQVKPSRDFTERTLAYLAQHRLEFSWENKSQKRSDKAFLVRPPQRFLKPASIGAALVACMIVAVLVLPSLSSLKVLLGILPTVSTESSTVPVSSGSDSTGATGVMGGSVATSSVTSTAQPTGPSSTSMPTLMGGVDQPLPFSSLNLTVAEPVEWPKGVVLPSASLAKEGNYAALLPQNGDFVIKATVSNVRFNVYTIKYQPFGGLQKSFLTKEQNRYLVSIEHTVVYEVRIDRIFHTAAGTSAKVGETLVIETPLATLDRQYSKIALQKNRQYILTVKRGPGDLVSPEDYKTHEAILGNSKTESPYYLMFAYTPSIELTQDGYYLFYADPTVESQIPKRGIGSGWIDLITDQTRTVIMEPGTSIYYKNGMKLRTDDAFEEDFQKLVNRAMGK